MPKFTPEKFLDFVSYYDPKNNNHVESLLSFAKEVSTSQPELLSDDAAWVIRYRTKPQADILAVPYFPQRDNYRDALRTCFSSSCAMLLEFLQPGTLPGPTGDDLYIRKVFSIGDTTIASVQVKALASFGLKTSFTTTYTFEKLDSQLESGKPVPIGILHRGPANKPSGGGHWIIVIGKVLDQGAPGGCWYIVHDPFGELDHATGTYPITDGKAKRYSKRMLGARWTVEGDGSGYAIIA